MSCELESQHVTITEKAYVHAKLPQIIKTLSAKPLTKDTYMFQIQTP